MKLKRLNLDWHGVVQKLEKDHPLTTFETARICGVTPATIQLWIKHGKLGAFQTPGKHRRIYKDQLFKFITLYQIKAPQDILNLLSGVTELTQPKHSQHPSRAQKSSKQALMLGFEPETAQLILEQIKQWDQDYEVNSAQTIFEAGKHIGAATPRVVIINTAGFKQAAELFSNIKADKSCGHTKILVVKNGSAPLEAALKYASDELLTSPLNLALLKKYFSV